MLHRYVKDVHPTLVPLALNSTIIWKRMCHIRLKAEKHMQWIIGQGHVDVRLDKWLPFEVPVMDERVTVRSFFINDNELDTNRVTSLLGSSLCDAMICEQISLLHSEDRLV